MAINTVEILSGHYQGSAEIIIECDAVEGTEIVLYKFVNGTKTQIGSGLIADGIESGKARIELTENIAIGNIVQGYVEEFGLQGGEPIVVYEATTGIKTGWRNPSLVLDGEVESDYDIYLANGGLEIASKYEPTATINNTVTRTQDDNTNRIDFVIEQKYTTSEIGGDIVNVCVVTVKGFNNAIGNPSISWDGEPLEQTYQKTYVSSQNGEHTVNVVSESINYIEKQTSFTVNISDVAVEPSVTDIWSSSYGINPVADRQVFLSAFSNLPLESRILISGSEVFTAMTGSTGSRFEQVPILNVPNGNYVGEIRVTGTTAVLTVDVRVTF